MLKSSTVKRKKGRDGGGQGNAKTFDVRIENGVGRKVIASYRVGEMLKNSFLNNVQRLGGVGKGAIGVIGGDLLRSLQEIQLGLDNLQRIMDILIKVKLLKREVWLDSSLGLSNESAGDLGSKGVGGIKEIGIKKTGPVAQFKPKVSQATVNGQFKQQVKAGPKPKVPLVPMDGQLKQKGKSPLNGPKPVEWA